MDEDIDLLEQNLRNELGLNWTVCVLFITKLKKTNKKKTIGEQYKSREEEEWKGEWESRVRSSGDRQILSDNKDSR